MEILYHKAPEKSVDILKTIEKHSVKCASPAGFDSFRLLKFQSFEQPAYFLFCQKFCFRFIPRPPETSVVKPFVKK
jgi:hypothetical protein